MIKLTEDFLPQNSINERDAKRNAIVKDMDSLLRKIDSRVTWIDYIPGKYISTNWDLVAIGVDSKVKYVNVTGKSPFKLVNEVLNAMDDFRLDVQFLNNRQFAFIEKDISQLAKIRALLIANANQLITHLSKEDCVTILHNAQENGFLPRFYLEDLEKYDNSDPKKLLMQNFESYNATLLDTVAIAKMVEDYYIREIENDYIYEREA